MREFIVKGKTIEKKQRHTIKHSKENALEEQEKEEIFRTIKSLHYSEELKYKYEVLVHLMINCGLRVSEALQVRLEWFKETKDGLALVIPQRARDLHNMKRDWKPKTEAGSRELLFIDPAVGEKVKSYFITNKAIGMRRQRAYHVIKLIGAKMNKPGIHPHALRSTHANDLVAAGVNDSTLCYRMGWNDLKTAKNYISMSEVAARRDLIKKMRE